MEVEVAYARPDKQQIVPWWCLRALQPLKP